MEHTNDNLEVPLEAKNITDNIQTQKNEKERDLEEVSKK